MKAFHHVNAGTVDEAIALLESGNGRARVIAGGTDLLGILKDRILPDYPETVINLKSIKNLEYIKEDGGILKIGVLTKLEDIVHSPLIQERCKVPSDTAKSVASPQIRNLGTIGGNICQEVRCLYYRYPHQIGERMLCKRKGGKSCFAVAGDNRFCSIMGGKGCFAVCPSDMATTLTALDADILVAEPGGTRIIPIRDFYTDSGNILGTSEIITEFQVKSPPKDERIIFLKFRLRNAIDFAIVSVASAITVAEGACKEARIVLGAVAPVPTRAGCTEAFLKSKKLTEEIAQAAAGLAIETARPMSMNAYKIQITRKLVTQAIKASMP
jgi:xanthine dehydrogenase YagS FAD-binding subunit